MFAFNLISLTLLFVNVSCRHVFINNHLKPVFFRDGLDTIRNDFEDMARAHPRHFGGDLPRVRRQIQRKMTISPDGTALLNAKIPITSGENQLSGLGSINSQGVFGGGLALENENGHALSFTGRHIPDFANQLTGAAKFNIINNDDHKLDVNTFLTRNMPHNSDIPSFNTIGGSLDYMYKDKIGGSLGMAHNDLMDRNDYSAMGNLNLYRGRDSSLDFTGGFSKSISPYMESTGWEPSVGLSFSRSQ